MTQELSQGGAIVSAAHREYLMALGEIQGLLTQASEKAAALGERTANEVVVTIPASLLVQLQVIASLAANVRLLAEEATKSFRS